MNSTQPDFSATLEAVRILLKMPSQFGALGFREVEKDSTYRSIGETIPRGTGFRSEQKFHRDSLGGVPALDLYVEEWANGYHVMVNSSPYDIRYHRNTPSPIPLVEVLGQVKKYIGEVTTDHS